MNLAPIEEVSQITKEEFVKKYYKPQKPVLLKGITDSWNEKWTFDHIKSLAGNQTIPLYSNARTKGTKSTYDPVTTMNFGEYIDLMRSGPTDLRIFFYTIKDHCPELLHDFEYPEIGLKYFKRLPALFFGGSDSKVFAHYDIDLPDNLHIHFEGHKRVLLFGPEQSTALYKVPFSIHNAEGIDLDKPDYGKFPALKYVNGFEVNMEHGDALYMPSGWWHYIVYRDPGFSMTLRSLPLTPKGKLGMMYNVFVMRLIDNIMRKIKGQKWIDYKNEWALRRTNKKFGFS